MKVLVASSSVVCGIIISVVPAAAWTAPEWTLLAACAARLPTTHGLLPFRVASTSEIHLSATRFPVYVTSIFATCGMLDRALCVVVKVRAGVP